MKCEISFPVILENLLTSFVSCSKYRISANLNTRIAKRKKGKGRGTTSSKYSSNPFEGVPSGAGIEIDPSTGMGLRERTLPPDHLPSSSLLFPSYSSHLPSSARATRSRWVRRLYGSICCTLSEVAPWSPSVSNL